jgi:haloacetate dehalogenase
MFDEFALERIDVGEAVLRVRHGGSGPPVLLLHGHPRTHTTWHRVAPLLATDHTVVCPDLRGYGESSKPPTTSDHEPYSKRAMARDLVALMHHLGHERFGVVGHDRGAYAASRLALDHPAAVTGLCVMDAVPIGEALARCDATFAASWWHWFFFGEPETPERVINADPDAWYRARYGDRRARMGEENWEDYHRAINDPQTVHAMIEDYRAGLGIDRAHDDADKAAGRRISCPTLVIWALGDDLVDLYGDPLTVWRDWTTDLQGACLDCGHHMAEERPEELAARLRAFFSGGDSVSMDHSRQHPDRREVTRG